MTILRDLASIAAAVPSVAAVSVRYRGVRGVRHAIDVAHAEQQLRAVVGDADEFARCLAAARRLARERFPNGDRIGALAALRYVHDEVARVGLESALSIVDPGGTR